MIGQTHANGWLVTKDMADHVQGYVDTVRSFGGDTSTERTVKLTSYITGRLDASSALATGALRIIDLKYGFDIVEVEKNTTLLIYAGAEYRRLVASGVHVTEIELVIYQPRAFHPDGIYRPWKLTPAELEQWVTWIVERGEACQAPEPVATPGDHCKNCIAKASCAANAFSVYAGYQYMTDNRQRFMTPEELAKELDFLDHMSKLLESRKTGVKTEAEARINRGEQVVGWGMKPRYSNSRVFTVSPDVVYALTLVNPYTTPEPKLMSPAELEKAGANAKIVKELAETKIVGYKLDRVTDKDLKKAFKGLV